MTNINLSIIENEVISIIGPSGSGKSTLLRLISNLEKTNKGSIKIKDKYLLENGKYNKNIKDIMLNVGMIFQDYSLFDNLNVKDNIGLALKLVLNKSKDEIDEITKALLKKVNLSDKLLSYPKELSGGEKQRISIARSLAVKPKILLIDEPTSALDIESIENLIKIIDELKKDNMTLVIVTHDLEFAKKVSSRVIFMEKSKILYDSKNDNIDQIENERFLKFINKK